MLEGPLDILRGSGDLWGEMGLAIHLTLTSCFFT